MNVGSADFAAVQLTAAMLQCGPPEKTLVYHAEIQLLRGSLYLKQPLTSDAHDRHSSWGSSSESYRMFERTKPLATAIWKRFRGFPLFVQLLLVVPILSAIALTLLVGNMGLALMGTAVAINSFLAGWFGGILVLLLGKAGIIVAKDHKKKD